MKHWHSIGRLLPLLLMVTFVLAGCEPSALNPVGKVAKMQGSLMALSLGIMLLVIIVVMVIFFYVIFRFRKNKDEDIIPQQIEGNTKLEMTWTIIPIILLAIIAVPTVYQVFVLADNDAPKANAKNEMTVKVTANQYWWQFKYPDQKITTASDLYVPTGTKVHIELTSNDVIHSFWVPSLFGKKDANPGLTNKMYFSVDKPGVYKGKCAELCGPSHAFMDFKVVAVSPAEFKKWTKKMSEGAVKPQTATAEQGQKIFKQQCLSCHAVGEGKDQPDPGIAPNLTGFADRQTVAGILKFNKQNLKDWIHDAPSMKEDINMPSFKDTLSNKQVNAIMEYLLNQKTGIEVPK